MRLPDVVAAWGIADGTHDHEVACRWLADQIRAGKIRARKIRRHWWMSLDDRLDAGSSPRPRGAHLGNVLECVRNGLIPASAGSTIIRTAEPA